jgi:hypothetical protein
MTAAFRVSRCLLSWETARGALSRARRLALPRLAGRRTCRVLSSMCKTPTRPLPGRFRGRDEATRALTISAGGCLHEHDCGPLEHPDPRNPRRDDCHAPAGSCLLIGAAAEALRGQGSSNRCSTFPVAIARARDLAPTPIAPGTWCRETPSPAGLERRGGRSDAASVERACKARPPEGRCGGGHPRRCPALTNPRCLLSQGRSRTNGRMPVSRS